MSPDQLFDFSNAFVLLGWVLLMAFPRWEWSSKIVLGVVIMLLCVLYALLIFNTLTLAAFENFSSLDGVMSLFADKNAVVLGWAHYLAFDLFVGRYVLFNSQKHNVPHLLIVPCLLFTFMLGPIGLLLYIGIRSIRERRYFPLS